MLLAGLLHLSTRAQTETGNTCATAINAADGNYWQNRGNGWFSFTANGYLASYALTRNNVSDPIAIEKATVYSGNCSGLTAIASDVLSSSSDPQLNLVLTGLTNGQTYYVKTEKINFSTGCVDCLGDTARFNLARLPENCNIIVEVFSIWQYQPFNPPPLLTYTVPSSQYTINLPPLCAGNSIHMTDNFPNSNTVTVMADNGNTITITTSVIPTGTASVPFVYTVPQNTTGTVLNYTLYYGAVPLTLQNYTSQACKYLEFQVMPNPPVNYTVVPNPVCLGTPVCFNMPPNPNLGTLVNDMWVISNPTVIPGTVVDNALQNLSLNLPSGAPLSNIGTGTCVPTTAVGTFTSLLLSYYTSSVTNGVGCVNSNTISYVVTPPAGTISISSATNSVCKNSAITLSANINPAITTVTWLPMNTNGLTVSVSPTVTTTYTLIGSTAAGCTTQAVFTLEAQDCCNPNFPKALTNCTIVANGTGGSIPFATVTSATNALIAAPANGVLTASLFVKGNLSINAVVTLSGSRVIFDEAAAVIQNSQLTINRCYLSGCNKNWKGIETRALLTMSNSVMEDAQNGIITSVSGSITHPGVVLYNNIFNKNNISVVLGFKQFGTVIVRECLFTNRVLSYATLYLTGNLWRNFTAYTPSSLNITPTANLMGSTILGLSNAKRGQVGIAFTAAQSSQSGNPPLNVGQNVSQATYVNLFDNMPVGVFCNGSKVNVLKNQFNNISATNGYDTYVTQTSGVYAESSNVMVGTVTGSIGSVASNSFVTGTTGVMGTINSSVTVGANQFTNLSYGVFLTKLYNSASNNFTNTVVNNTFLNNLVDVNCFDNQKNNTTIMSNTSNHVPAAFKSNQAFNVVLAELSSNQNCAYKVESNNFTGKFTYGVYAVQVYGASVSNNTITMKPPFGGNFMGNIWITNSSQMIVKNNILNVNPSASQNWNTFGIYTAVSTNNLYCNNDIKRTGASMKFEGTCPSKIYGNKLNNLPSDSNQVGLFLDNNATVGNINIPVSGTFVACAENEFGYFKYADTYVNNNSQGSLIDYTGAFSSNNQFCPFKNEPLFSPQAFIPVTNNNTGYVDCGAPNLIQQQRVSTGVAPVINNQVNFGANTQTALHIADKGIFEMMRKSNVNASNVNGGTNFMSSMVNTTIDKFNKVDSLTARFAINQSTATLQQAENLNLSTSANNTIDQNQKTFNGVYHTYLKGIGNVSASQWNSLKSLAALCPFTDGTSVYQARTLLINTGDTTKYINPCEISVIPLAGNNRLMNNTITGITESNVLALNTAVFPNPASSELNITTDLTEAELTVMNVLGEVVIKTVLNPVTKLDVSNLKNGTYLYTISLDKTIIKSDKLIITK